MLGHARGFVAGGNSARGENCRSTRPKSCASDFNHILVNMHEDRGRLQVVE